MLDSYFVDYFMFGKFEMTENEIDSKIMKKLVGNIIVSYISVLI